MSSGILMVGHGSDPTFAYSVHRAEELEFETHVFELDGFPTEGRIEIDKAAGLMRLASPTGELRATEFAGCFARVGGGHQPPEWQRDPIIISRCRAIAQWVQALPCLVATRPFADGGNASKVYQLGALQSAGFAVPETLLTSDPEAARRFVEAGRTVYKSCSGIRSIVRELDMQRAETLASVAVAPVQLQRMVDGDDARVHLVGSTCIAERIVSPDVDYRYAPRSQLRFLPIDPPEKIVRSCRRFASRRELVFLGFDFKICRETGVWFCLEANPMPGYDGYDQRSGGLISQELLTMLADPTRRPSQEAAR